MKHIIEVIDDRKYTWSYKVKVNGKFVLNKRSMPYSVATYETPEEAFQGGMREAGSSQ